MTRLILPLKGSSSSIRALRSLSNTIGISRAPTRHFSTSKMAAATAPSSELEKLTIAPQALTNGDTSTEIYKPRFVDIGINLTDSVYSGSYHGTQRHENDLEGVLARAKEAGCRKLIVTGSDLEESKKALELGRAHPGFLYSTVGVHPCSSLTFTKHPLGDTALLNLLHDLITTTPAPSPIVAFGEIGLDYDRLDWCPKETQVKYFAAQLDVATRLSPPLPLFLHSRAAATDFARLLRERLDKLPKRGVVHSFTGTVEEMLELVEMGFDIGVNGCSLKTEENCDVVKNIPLERLQLETDGPWCEIRATHASSRHLKGVEEQKKKKKDASESRDEVAESILEWEAALKSVKKEKWVEGALVKGRNEPCMIGRVAVAVARIKGVSVQEVAEAAWENSVRMFGLGKR